MGARRAVTISAVTIALIAAACGGSESGTVADPVSEEPPATAAAADTDDAADAGDTSAPAEEPAPTPTDGSTGDTATADPSAADAPDILRFTAPLVGGGELDATTTAGTPTAFWFWAPT